MSAAAARATARPAPRATPRTPRTAGQRVSHLRLVVARRSSAARAPFLAVVVLIMAIGMLGLLLLNTVLAQDAFRLHALQLQGRALADQEQALQREVDRLQSPQSLAARAAALGMVPGGPPAFLRLADGQVLGAAVPGAVPPPVAAAVTPATAPVIVKPKPAAAPAAGTWVAVPAQSKPAKAKPTKATR